LGDVAPEIVFCFATGNTARLHDLDCGLIAPGRVADYILIDQAQHAAGRNMLDSIHQGNLPGVGMTVIDGIVRSQRSRNTPPADRLPNLVSGGPPMVAPGGH
jgi:enamidase